MEKVTARKDIFFPLEINSNINIMRKLYLILIALLFLPFIASADTPVVNNFELLDNTSGASVSSPIRGNVVRLHVTATDPDGIKYVRAIVLDPGGTQKSLIILHNDGDSAHGDFSASDDIYSSLWLTSYSLSSGVNYTIVIKIMDNLGNIYSSSDGSFDITESCDFGSTCNNINELRCNNGIIERCTAQATCNYWALDENCPGVNVCCGSGVSSTCCGLGQICSSNDNCLTCGITCDNVCLDSKCVNDPDCQPGGCCGDNTCDIDINECSNCSNDCNLTDCCGNQVCNSAVGEDFNTCPGDCPCIDSDGDGQISTVCGGDDCDDSNDDRFLGNQEVCDGVDNDCNASTTDEDLCDSDHDNYCNCDEPFKIGSNLNAICNTNTTNGFHWSQTCDCDDNNSNINPGVTENCTSPEDDDCDGQVNDLDIDCGGTGTPASPILTVSPSPAVDGDFVTYTMSATGLITHYEFYSCEGASCVPIDSTTLETSSNSYSQSGTIAGPAVWNFQLQACNDNGCSNATNVQTFIINPQTVPNNVSLTVTPDTVNINESVTYSWSADGNIDNYGLQFKYNDQPWSSFINYGLTTSITEVSDMAGDFQIRARACNGHGCGYSTVRTLTVNAEGEELPSNVNFNISPNTVVTGDNVTYSWSAIDAESFEYVSRFNSGTWGTWSTLSNIGDPGSLTNPAGTPGIYEYILRACNSFGCSEDNIQTLTVNNASVVAPTNPAITINPAITEVMENISFTLGANGTVDYYEFYSCEGAGCTPVDMVNFNVAQNPYSFNATQVNPGTFRYMVNACNIIGCSGNSNIEDLVIYPSGTCDTDNDTYLEDICGGNDCDDDDDEMFPGNPEICDGKDNDCNDQTNDGCNCVNGTTQPCGTDVGLCEAGEQTCIVGEWGTCLNQVGPTAEICDNEDNNCNTQTDEGLTVICNNNSNCNDSNDCTVDTCNNPGSCFSSCSNDQVTSCQDSDGCCPNGCNFSNDNDCAPGCTPDGCNNNCPVNCSGADDPDCSGTCLDCSCSTDTDCGSTCAQGDGCCVSCSSPIDLDCDMQDPNVNTFNAVENNDNADISWTVTDQGGSQLDYIAIWRAPYNASNCHETNKSGCVWSQIQTINISGDSQTGSHTDSPGNGSWWYGMHVYDNAGNWSQEPTPPGVLNVEIAPACTPSLDCSDYPGNCNVNLFDGCDNILNCSNNCSGGESCCSGSCQAPTCSNNSDCDDSNNCTTDTCNNPGGCSASCSNSPSSKANGEACSVDCECASGVCTNNICVNGVNKTIVYRALSSHNGNFGGRSGLDSYCANNKPANLPGNVSNIHAFISVSDTDELRDMPNNYGYDSNVSLYWFKSSNTTFNKFADNWADMLDGSIQLSRSDGGDSGSAWSGSKPDGSVEQYNGVTVNCDQWISDAYDGNCNQDKDHSSVFGSNYTTSYVADGSYWQGWIYGSVYISYPSGCMRCSNSAYLLCAGEMNASCTPSLNCSDYPGNCGINLFDGCDNILNCSNNCSGGEVCCSDSCQAPACSNNSECNDSDNCTTDTCNNPGSCSASCSNTQASCQDGDGCCPSGCDSGNDNDCLFIPDTFTWRDYNGSDWMSPMRYQAMCGSCWAFATMGVAEGKYNIQENNPALDVDLSEQYVTSDCCSAGTCNGGGHSFNCDTTDESCYPYIPGQDLDSLSSCSGRCADWSTRVWDMSDYSVAPNAYTAISDPDAIKTLLMNEGPVWAAMGDASSSSFVYSPADQAWICTNDDSRAQDLNHAIVLVGWDDNIGCWWFKNSWGMGWGDGGYGCIKYGECLLEADYYLNSVISP
jgi:C1A family cysteine protease